MEHRKKYKTLRLTIIELEAVDILTTSDYTFRTKMDVKYQTNFTFSPWAHTNETMSTIDSIDSTASTSESN